MKEYAEMQESLGDFKNINANEYLNIRKKAVLLIWDDHKEIYELIKEGPLGRNARFLNLITDIYVNTFNPSSSDPHEFLKDFSYFSIVALNASNAFQTASSQPQEKADSRVLNQLFEEMFSEPGSIKTKNGKFFE